MKLQELISDIALLNEVDAKKIEINKIEFDSRKIEQNDLFVAIKGTQVDGHNFIQRAIEKGASVIVLETLPVQLNPEIAYLQVKDSAKVIALLAARFYDHPSRKLSLVGITGTNGKTTSVTLLFDLFSSLGYKCGLLSTIENKIGTQQITSTHTTPDALAINALLKEMVDQGCDYAFMEVSSHAVDQQRVAGLQFAGGVFTNISHDHLDYHKTFKAYIEAKKAFFDALPSSAFALTNVDDKRGSIMLQNTSAKKRNYSLRGMADFRAKIIESDLMGLQIEIDNRLVYSRLIGEFNAYNLLVAYAVGVLLGQNQDEILQAISQLKSAKGRFDYIVDEERKRIGVVDYAHTPDALQKVLKTIQQIRKGSAQIITVVGCGGDRDREKRPKMAKVAYDWSDQVVLTSDNPRSEDPAQIITDMEQGIPAEAGGKVLSISDRKQAIRTACRLARSGDIILVAGKGHEQYQEIKGVKHPFDDKEILKTAFSGS